MSSEPPKQFWQNVWYYFLQLIQLLIQISKYILGKSQKLLENISQMQWNRLYLQCFFLLFVLVVFIGGQTRSIRGPFGNIVWLILAILVMFPTGYIFSGRFSKDGRWATFLGLLSLLLMGVYFVLAIRSFSFEQLVNFNQPIHLFGCLTVGVISLWAGVLSGQMNTPTRMGDDLFHQHIRPKMVNNRIHLIHWDSDGKVTIIKPSKIVMKWDEHEKKINLLGRPLHEYAPALFQESGDGGEVNPALSQLSDYFSSLPVIWNHMMSKHFEELKKGHDRICWLHLLQVSIPYNPTSLSYRREIFDSHSNRMNVVLPWKEKPNSRIQICWPMPENNWRFDYPKYGEHSALSSALGRGPLKLGTPLEVEKEIIQSILPNLAKNSRTTASTHFLRSMTHLFLILREQIDSGNSTQANLCRRSIRDISQWFKTLNTQETIIPFDQNISYVISVDEWSDWISKAFIQPPTVFLRLHDSLTRIVSNQDSDEKAQVNAEITGLVNACTRDVIETASQRAEEAIGSPKEWSNFGEWQDVNITRRSTLLVGIWKMLLILSLYQNIEEVAV